MVSDAVQRGGFRGGGFAGQGGGELVAAGGELGCLGAQFAESPGEEFGVEGAVLEGVQIAVDRLLSLGEFGGDGSKFGAGAANRVVVVEPLSVDGLADQVVTVVR
ncbi:hypothetical protein [Nocardia sp. CA-145437]|uniref:hypothetical protein n=1 Tax=Nocardia sp. CA-145437 TaxID=3239980 RepID=UPI003D9520BD